MGAENEWQAACEADRNALQEVEEEEEKDVPRVLAQIGFGVDDLDTGARILALLDHRPSVRSWRGLDLLFWVLGRGDLVLVRSRPQFHHSFTSASERKAT